MAFSFKRTAIPEVMLIAPLVLPDQRGFFMETYKRSDFAAQGIDEIFVQCNHSKSSRGILRGLHYQKNPKAQAKLIRVLWARFTTSSSICGRDGPYFSEMDCGDPIRENQDDAVRACRFCPRVCVTSEEAEILYMATEEYAPLDFESGVIWNDPDVAIDWPISEPILSPRDRAVARLREADNNLNSQQADSRQQQAGKCSHHNSLSIAESHGEKYDRQF
jgi:dTDP-4-dehydrorhamnose 3,5-epimerase